MTIHEGRGGRRHLFVLCVLAGLLVATAFALQVHAQRGPPGQVFIPSAPPDLVVTLDVPAEVQQSGSAAIQIRVDNTLTPVGYGRPSLGGSILGGSAVDDVHLLVRFAGLEPLLIQGDSGFQCGLAGGGGTTPPTYATCTGGKIGAGGTATIALRVKERGSCTASCGPVYTDAMVVSYTGPAERSKTNNRALGATDTVDCIN